MLYEFGKESFRSFEDGIKKEWLLTNGIGGFASSTIIGANTRRYHGLLVAAMHPPAARHLIVSKIDESVTLDGKQYNLYSSRTPDHTMAGYLHLRRVVIGAVPRFEYGIMDTSIVKTVCMVYGRNTVAVVYRIINGQSPLRLRLTPLVNFRDYHHNSERRWMNFQQSREGNRVTIRPPWEARAIRLFCSQGTYTPLEGSFYLNMYYEMEARRGLNPQEDHYIPGYFDIEAGPREDKTVTLLATVEEGVEKADGDELVAREEARVSRLFKSAAPRDDFEKWMVLAADRFIVSTESTGSKSIIAGYPWFADWGRDALIALPGLTLCTGRYADAEEILQTFASYEKNGLLPNLFSEHGREPSYNSVDAPLWLFEAVEQYLSHTGKLNFVMDRLFGPMESIIKAYMQGTAYGIAMDRDFLIKAGSPETQLTWMDVKIHGKAVTPRDGKAVEINALWYNALKVMGRLSEKTGKGGLPCGHMADKVKESFVKAFWNEEKGCLYDVVKGDERDGRLRPNQILSVSLSHPVLEGEKARRVVDRVWKELYTPYGLRTLAPGERDYRGVYEGDPFHRDTAYHQGTVWPWLTGHFVRAYARVYGCQGENRERIKSFLLPFKDHLRDACVGTVSEVFDGDEPHAPGGCFAQAWSVAEVFRAYREFYPA